MKKIRLKKLEIQNFKGITNKTVEFSDKTTVKGRNAVGKSTLYDAVLWLLFDKLASGNSATDIRPHDKYGKDIDFVDILVSATFDVDGREITLKKTQKQKWTKKRSSDSKTFEGNVNEFSVNDIPKSQKDYKQYLSENLCDEDTFLACTNAQSFFRLDTKKRRAKLMSLASDITNQDVVATDKSFEALSPMLAEGTVEELVTRSKGTIKRLNEQLKTIPARIDEQQKSKVSIDVAELELGKKSYLEQITEIDDKLSDLSKQYEEYQKASDGALEIKFAMSDLAKKSNMGLVNQKKEIRSLIDEKIDLLMNIDKSIQRNKREIEGYKNDIESGERERKRLVELWKSVKSEVFNEETAVCPTCHRTLPDGEISSLREEFEKSKEERLAKITKDGNLTKADIDNANAMIPKLEECNRDNIANKEKLEKEVAELEKQLSELHGEIDITDSQEYKELEKQLSEKEAFMAQGNSADEVRNDLQSQKKALQSEIEKINAELAKAQRNVDIDERVAELQAEQVETSQKIADEEKILALLEEFNRKKMTMLTDEVNKNFRLVNWRLFDDQINGGQKEICQILVNGSNYETCLNTGHKILADIDILTSLQRINEVSLPVVVDNSEVLNAFNVPDIDGQMILLKVSDDKEMVVE